MEKILSTRIDEAVYHLITSLSVRMHTSKKAIIEESVKLLNKYYEQEHETDILAETSGVWNRGESPAETVAEIRSKFNLDLERNKR